MACGTTSANALWLGDSVKLDEQCSLEARSPNLRQSQAFFYALAFFWLDGISLLAPAQVPHKKTWGNYF
jgi:hypothetical protein